MLRRSPPVSGNRQALKEVRHRWPTYISFAAMIVAACGLVYLTLSQLPRQRYILQSILQEKGQRLLEERSLILEKTAWAEKVFSSLSAVDLTTFSRVRANYPFVESAFFIDQGRRIVVPKPQIYAEWHPQPESIEDGASHFLDEGKECEFSTPAQLERAVELYRLCLANAVHTSLEVQASLALCACLYKLRRYEEAAGVVRQAIGKIEESGLNPYCELTARYYLGCSLKAIKADEAREVFIETYEKLLHGHFLLSRPAQRRYWEKLMRELLEECPLSSAQRDKIDELSRESRLRAADEELRHSLDNRTIDEILAQARRSDPCIFYLGEPPQPLLLVCRAAARDTIGAVGFSIRPGPCEELLQGALEGDPEFTFALLNPDGKGLPGSVPQLNALASQNLEHWRNFQLAVYLKNPQRIEAAIQRERLLLLSITILVALILFAGVYFTFRSYTREVELSRLKSDFVACISHELRTPLALIQSHAETLSLGRVGDAKKGRYYRVILTETQRLTRLIQNILNISRIESGCFPVNLEEAHPLSMVEGIAEERQLYWPEYVGQIRLEVEKVPSVYFDEAAIRLALFNLMDNAVKYGGFDRDITVGVRHRGAELCLWVQDRGPGILPQDREKIFKNFYRGHAHQGTRGIGLGLPLVRHIARAHGGKVEVTGAMGCGSRFEICIPWRKDGGNQDIDRRG